MRIKIGLGSFELVLERRTRSNCISLYFNQVYLLWLVCRYYLAVREHFATCGAPGGSSKDFGTAL